MIADLSVWQSFISEAGMLIFDLMGFGNKNKQKYVGFFILFKRFLDGP